MSKKKTEIICIIDESGSMWNLTKDTIGGFNKFIDEQKGVEGKARVTTVLFDHDYHLLYENKKLKDVPYLTDMTYIAGGATALLYAVGHTIETISERHKNKSPDNTVVLIITDGEENSSSLDYSKERVKELVEQHQEKGWEFFFLGANIDSFAEAGGLGIGASFTMNYEATSVGVSLAYGAISKAVTRSRSGTGSGSDTDWKEGD